MTFKPNIKVTRDAIDHMEPDRIFGTDKTMTFCANASLFSRESDLDQIPTFLTYRKRHVKKAK